ncbi:hypothetical protein H2201_001191 [Coniosporium apollinis]|uniref:Zn(2)-C6 fungal-type domain-containing protein n=1 Tax=Coniosporium apollinis TaxID=61459 RepID=A0ABQ9P1Q9_9PEZI|nr:hypothetical protein H2201_001191 [Coniosporium apollinis]
MSDCSASSSDPAERPQQQQQQNQQKRKASAAGVDGHATGRPVKRRASKACQCCRSRKVRCNVTEHGAPCTNCRLDEVECIVSESRRKKKWTKDDENPTVPTASAANAGINTGSNSSSRKLVSRAALDGIPSLATARLSRDVDSWHEEHVPHSIYQTHNRHLSHNLQDSQRKWSTSTHESGPVSVLGYSPISVTTRQTYLPPIAPKQTPAASLPLYIKPLPARIGSDEITYLEKKGALTIPNNALRNELLRAYIEFVHPYMPLLDLHEFIEIVDKGDGSDGKLSLILFQAVMFAGSAFIDMRHLRKAGYLTRKEARKDFFLKTRLLYDFDYESDRISLVQALLLLTYYYETPDDQKDTWHWMGVATSVAHTIGLHRNPENSNMDAKRTRLWKRIWWSTYMRDRLIALGMRRPTRIKPEDFDVPMLTLDDFSFRPVSESSSCVPASCTIARDVDKQRELAIMCIEKAKLCLCISQILSKQYCVLNNNQGLLNDRTTMMLLPKKLDAETCDVQACDDELQKWLDELPKEARFRDESSGNDSIDLHRSLLHMVFFTTLSALHRPQVLPSTPSHSPGSSDDSADLLDVSRRKVRRAAAAITSIVQSLDSRNLVRYLPTTGVTVLLPAIIIHLLDIKAPDEETRRSSLRGFCQCMQVMGKLRDLYAAADYSTAFLEAAIRKAGIQISPFPNPVGGANLNALSKPEHVTTVEDLVDAGRRLDLAQLGNNISRTLTPPPEEAAAALDGAIVVTDEEVARRLETFLASTPPESDHHEGSEQEQVETQQQHDGALFPGFELMTTDNFDERDFDTLLNLDATMDAFAFNEGASLGFAGESWVSLGMA